MECVLCDKSVTYPQQHVWACHMEGRPLHCSECAKSVLYSKRWKLISHIQSSHPHAHVVNVGKTMHQSFRDRLRKCYTGTKLCKHITPVKKQISYEFLASRAQKLYGGQQEEEIKEENGKPEEEEQEAGREESDIKEESSSIEKEPPVEKVATRKRKKPAEHWDTAKKKKPEETHSCKLCSKVVSRWRRVDHAHCSHTDKKRYKCSECPFVAHNWNKHNMAKHLKTTHPRNSSAHMIDRFEEYKADYDDMYKQCFP